jgi:hypothetical protein
MNDFSTEVGPSEFANATLAPQDGADEAELAEQMTPVAAEAGAASAGPSSNEQLPSGEQGGRPAPQQDNDEGTGKPPKEDYEVGYRRPPKATRFKPGKSGNPSGRPKGSFSAKAILARMLKEKVPAEKDGKAYKISRWEVVVSSIMEKAEQDSRFAKVMVDFMKIAGLFNEESDETKRVSVEAAVQPGSGRLCERWLENVDPSLLIKDEQIELSRLAELIDEKADLLALAPDELLEWQRLVNKGRAGTARPNVSEAL